MLLYFLHNNSKAATKGKLKPQLLAVINLGNELCCCCHTKKGFFRFHITIVMCVNFFLISIPTFYSFFCMSVDVEWGTAWKWYRRTLKSISHILSLIKCTCISALDCISCQVVPFLIPFSHSRRHSWCKGTRREHLV